MRSGLRWYQARLWLVSAALFAAGIIGRIVLDYQGEVAYSYPYAVGLQYYAYGAGLVVLLLWFTLEFMQGRHRTWVGWLLIGLAIASCAGVISSVPR